MLASSTAATQPDDSAPPGGPGAISSIAVNSLAVVVASACCKHLAVYSRAAAAAEQHSKQQQLVLLGSVNISMQGCDCLCFGGALHKQLVASTSDGSLLLLTQPDGAASSPADMQVGHAGSHACIQAAAVTELLHN